MAESLADRLIVVIPTSPIRSHPSTDLIDRTIDSVRAQVGPDPFLVILCDGVRPEQMDLRDAYDRYVAELKRKYRSTMENFVMRFLDHKHQVGMLRWFINGKAPWNGRTVKPHVLLVESDTPLLPEPINWDNVCGVLDSGRFDVVRFLFEGDINAAHRHMAGATIDFKGQKYVETCQYSARPNLATWDFYIRALAKFSPAALCFFEDLAHGFCQEDPNAWKIGIYYPDPPRARSFHLDGRQGDPKFDDTQIF